jgi:hypothetical protein
MERDRRLELLAVGLVGQRLARGSDHRERGGQEPLQGKVVERRDELARREVTGAAEDDDRRRLRRPREPKPFAQRVRDGRQRPYSFLTACPPNWLRSAAATFIA